MVKSKTCCLLAILPLVWGCSAPLRLARRGSTDHADHGELDATAATGVSPGDAMRGDGTPSPAGATGREARDGQEVQTDFAQVIAELEAIGAISPVARSQLIEQLKETDPELWPLLLRQFQATLALRQQQDVHSDSVAASNDNQPVTASMDLPVDQEVAAQKVGYEAALPLPLHTAIDYPDFRQPPAGVVRPSVASPGGQTALGNPISLAAGNLLSEAAAVREAVSTAERPGPTPPAQGRQVPPIGEYSDAKESAAGTTMSANSDRRTATGATWDTHFHDAIYSLEQAEPPAANSKDEVKHQLYLRLMYLVDGRDEDALAPVTGITGAEQDFWAHSVYGIATYLDNEAIPDDARRAAEAAESLNRASRRLGEIASLVVKNLAFCTETKSYGVLTPFTKDEFTPGQEVLLYAEVENFKSVPTPNGFATSLRAVYAIYDEQGRLVEEHEFEPETTDECRNPRRDFFVPYFIRMPERIYDGRYTLMLTIEDTKSRKIGQSSIAFEIKAD